MKLKIIMIVLLLSVSSNLTNAQSNEYILNNDAAFLDFKAMVRLLRQKPEKALPLAQEARRILAQHKTPFYSMDYAMAFNLLSIAYHNLGAYDLATETCDSALIIFRKIDDGKDEFTSKIHVMVLNTKANLLFIEGAYNEAILTIETAQKICESRLKPSSRFVIFTHMTRSNFYQYIGENSKAYSTLLKVKEAYEKKPFHTNHKYIKLLNNLAYNRMHAEDYKLAGEYFETALKVARRRYGRKSADYALVLNNYAELHTLTNEFCKAEKAYDKAIEIRRKRVDTFGIDYIISAENQCYLYKKSGRYKKAAGILSNLLLTIEEHYGTNHKLYITTLNNLAVATYLSGEAHKPKAIALFKQGLELQKNWLFGNYEILSETEKKKLLDQELRGYIDFWQQASLDTNAVSADESYRFVAFYKGMQLADKENAWERIVLSSDSSLKELLDSFKDKKALHRFERNKMPQTEKERLERLEKLDAVASKISVLEHELNLRSGVTKNVRTELTANAVQSKLDSNEVFIDFSSYRTWDKTWTDKRRYIAYVIRQGMKTEVVNLFEETELRDLLSGWYGVGGIDTVRGGFAPVPDSIDLNQNFRELHSFIFSKLEFYLDNCKKLTISPAGLLHLVNFNALMQENGRRLGTTYPIELVSSLRSIITRDKDNRLPFFADSTITLFGGIEYGKCQKTKVSDPVSEFALLSGSKLEVKTINSIFSDKGFETRLVKGEDATEESFLQLNGISPEVIHLATHGYFQKTDDKSNLDPMLRSGVAMAGINDSCPRWDSLSFLDHGALTAYEVSQLDLSHTRLVVLSACETGLGDIDASEGVFGLQRAFKMVGVDYLLISLWSVPDKKTQELMTLFYQNLLRNQGSVHSAFYQAQNEMAKIYPNRPQLWAAFILME